MRETSPQIYVSEDPIYASFNTEQRGQCPEKCLMVGMLARAFMDLTSIGEGIKHRRTAIKWFLSEDHEYILSYRNIRANISLSPQLQKHIDSTLSKAIESDREFKNDVADRDRSGSERGDIVTSPGFDDGRTDDCDPYADNREGHLEFFPANAGIIFSL